MLSWQDTTYHSHKEYVLVELLNLNYANNQSFEKYEAQVENNINLDIRKVEQPLFCLY
jgi:hypothetical protein